MSNKSNDSEHIWLFEKSSQWPSQSYNIKNDVSHYYPQTKIISGKNMEPKPGSRFYEINNVFKELVDHCISTGLCEENGNPIISIGNKKGFIKYVSNHSK